MQDVAMLVKGAIENGTVNEFLERWNADKNILVSYEDRPIYITQHAWSKDKSKYCSLEHIMQRSGDRHREIAFTGIIKSSTIIAFHKGNMGTHGLCDWAEGSLLPESYRSAEEANAQVALGHTHPAQYGGICSDIYWTKEELDRMKDPEARLMLEDDLYLHFGGDYSEMLVRSRRPIVSRVGLIGSPREDQLGVFEIHPEGKVVYRPWNIIP